MDFHTPLTTASDTPWRSPLLRQLRMFRVPLWAILLSSSVHLLVYTVLSAYVSPYPAQYSTQEPIQLTITSAQDSSTRGNTEIAADSLHQHIDGRAKPPTLLHHPEQATSLQAPELPTYFEFKELDTPIKPLEDIEPATPPGADPNISGSITLDVYLDKNGIVEKTSVADSTLDPQYAKSAAESFLLRKFEPGMREGVAVRTHLRIVIRYQTPSPANTIPARPDVIQ